MIKDTPSIKREPLPSPVFEIMLLVLQACGKIQKLVPGYNEEGPVLKIQRVCIEPEKMQHSAPSSICSSILCFLFFL